VDTRERGGTTVGCSAPDHELGGREVAADTHVVPCDVADDGSDPEVVLAVHGEFEVRIKSRILRSEPRFAIGYIQLGHRAGRADAHVTGIGYDHSLDVRRQ